MIYFETIALICGGIPERVELNSLRVWSDSIFWLPRKLPIKDFIYTGKSLSSDTGKEIRLTLSFPIRKDFLGSFRALGNVTARQRALEWQECTEDYQPRSCEKAIAFGNFSFVCTLLASCRAQWFNQRWVGLPDGLLVFSVCAGIRFWIEISATSVRKLAELVSVYKWSFALLLYMIEQWSWRVFSNDGRIRHVD